MTEAQIKHLVNRFLAWKLPDDFHPDCGIQFDAEAAMRLHPSNRRYEPIGTNLLTVTQAEAMVRYMIQGMPTWKADQETCKHINRRGIGSAGSDGASSFTGHCLDCGKDLSYKIEGSLAIRAVQNWLSNTNQN